MSFVNPVLLRGNHALTIELPLPTAANLSEVVEILGSSTRRPTPRFELKVPVPAETYVTQLLSIFDALREANDEVAMRSIFKIFTYLLITANIPFVILFVKENYVLRVLDVLNLGSKKKSSYRELLKNTPRMDETVPLNDRLRLYLREVDHLEFFKKNVLSLLAKKRQFLETIDQLLMWRQIDIINELLRDTTLSQQLLAIAQDTQTPIDQRLNVTQFLLHIFRHAHKDMSHFAANSFLRVMVNHGFLDCVQHVLRDEQHEMRRAATMLIACAARIDVEQMQMHILAQAERLKAGTAGIATASSTNGSNSSSSGSGGHAGTGANTLTTTLLQTVLQQWTSEDEDDMEPQLYEIIQRILGMGEMRVTSSHKRQAVGVPGNILVSQSIFDDDPVTGSVLKLFFARCTPLLLRRIDALAIESRREEQVPPLELTEAQAKFYTHLCQLVQNLLEQYGPRTKHILHGPHIFEKFAQLFRSTYIEVNLHTLRVFRACIGLRDNEIYRLMVNQRVISHILWLSHQALRNLNGALYEEYIEFFDYILLRNLTLLINHIMEKHSNHLGPIEHLEPIKAITAKYEMQKRYKVS
ncbi:hypothetical protein BC940DRAFT_335611 [Gongronella butleri]|nr:hypothetical protein BC940DRAFT_335611 [Gongronella butleri]